MNKLPIALVGAFAFISITFSFFTACGQLSTDKSNIPKFREGDIIFQTLSGGQGRAIQLATHSPYSHVGMVLFNEKGDTVVLEAVQPVKMTPWREWVDRGDKHHYVVKRLKNADEALTPKVIAKMEAIGKTMLGKPYDIYFGWTDDRLYCSELVWKIYHSAANIDVGELKPLVSYDLSSPIVQSIMKQRYGDHIPEDELMIAPGAIHDSPLLELVFSN